MVHKKQNFFNLTHTVTTIRYCILVRELEIRLKMTIQINTVVVYKAPSLYFIVIHFVSCHFASIIEMPLCELFSTLLNEKLIRSTIAATKKGKSAKYKNCIVNYSNKEWRS